MIPPHVEVFEDLGRLSEAAAERFVEVVQTAKSAGRPAVVAVSGGGTPKAMFKLLAQPAWADRVDWQNVHVFWADERLVPADDPESNYGSACQALFDHVPVPRSNLHRVVGEASPEAALAQCLADLAAVAGLQPAVEPAEQPAPRWPIFDLVFLGMGADGHTASLFPGPIPPEDQTTPARCVTAHYEDRPAHRITLTPAVFNDALEIVFLATGANKASVLASVLRGPHRPELLPVQRILPRLGRILWLVDAAAGAQLAPVKPA
jgi:6-phosphogluconolactonase